MAGNDFEALQVSLVGNRVVRVDHPSLPVIPATYLSASSAAAATSLTVRDNIGFLNTDFIIIGNFGDSRTELKRINAAINPGTTFGCTATTFAHAVNSPVRKIIYDKVEIYGNSTASSPGATLITTVDITPNADFTEYVDTGTTFAFYGARGIRSVATTFNGSYSDFISATGFASDTVGFLIQRAFESTGEKVRASGVLSKQWAYDQIFLCEQDISKELKKWSWLQEFEADMGNIALGDNSYALPTDISDDNTPKAIQGLRIGTGNNLTYITKAEYEHLFQNVAQSSVSTTYSAGATSIVLTDSRDFNDSGAINVYTGTSIDNVSYTTNTKSTNTLGTVTSNDSGGTALDPVWQGESQGLPQRYTIYEGVLYFDTVPDNSTNLIGANIWIDYYKKVVRVDTDGDTLTVPDPLCVQNWLEAMIKKAKTGGMLDLNDSAYIEYLRRKDRMIKLEVSGQSTNLTPSYFEDYNVW